MTDTITINMPRSWAEQVMNLLDALSYDENYDYDGCFQHWADYAKPETLASQLRAALEQPQVNSPEIPEGWKLVPMEATPEMLDAGRNACEGRFYPQDMLHGPRAMMADSWAAMLAAAPKPPVVEQPQVEAATGKDYLQVPAGFVLLQTRNGKPVYSACLDGGRFHGWLMWKHPDGQWVSKRKLEAWEIMQAEDQRDYGIVQGD